MDFLEKAFADATSTPTKMKDRDNVLAEKVLVSCNVTKDYAAFTLHFQTDETHTVYVVYHSDKVKSQVSFFQVAQQCVPLAHRLNLAMKLPETNVLTCDVIDCAEAVERQGHLRLDEAFPLK